jgi:hypothetical protein
VLLANTRMYARFAGELRGFLRERLAPDQWMPLIQAQLRNRAEVFLAVLERSVFARPQSPYRRLCEHAGIEFGDVARLVRRDGIEAALGRLYEAGVYLKPEEFKGRAPIERPGLQLHARSEDFDNPLLAPAFATRTGGSRGASTRIIVDLDLLAHDAAHNALSEQILGLIDRPRAQWRPAPPASAAMSIALRSSKIGRPLERWFSQNRLALKPEDLRYALFTHYVVAASRRHGIPVPAPEYVPVPEVARIAQWLADRVRLGTPALFDCPASSAVRVCLAALELGLDISDTALRVGGEPFTPAKAEILDRAGCRAVVRYSLTELGHVGMPCTNPAALDAVHLLTDKVAVIQRNEPNAGSLLVTSLLPSSPKLMLNVDVGDYGVLEDRDCGCPVRALGLGPTLHGVRSREKLTSEGMTFGGEGLLELVETILPRRFGGHATDYQLVEEEEAGLTRVSVVVSPRVGPLDEQEVASVVLDSLGLRHATWKMAAELWRQGQTLRVVRREPYATSAAKILPLYVVHRT